MVQGELVGLAPPEQDVEGPDPRPVEPGASREEGSPEGLHRVALQADPASGRVDLVRVSAAEAASRRVENEQRLASLLFELRALDLDPVLVSSDDHRDVVLSFLGWADQRLFTRGRA